METGPRLAIPLTGKSGKPEEGFGIGRRRSGRPVAVVRAAYRALDKPRGDFRGSLEQGADELESGGQDIDGRFDHCGKQLRDRLEYRRPSGKPDR